MTCPQGPPVLPSPPQLSRLSSLVGFLLCSFHCAAHHFAFGQCSGYCCAAWYCAACSCAALVLCSLSLYSLLLYSLFCAPAVGRKCMSVACFRKDSNRARSCVSSQCCQAVNTLQGCSERPALERQDLFCMYLAHHELESLNIMIVMMITMLSSLAKPEAAFSCLIVCLQHCSQPQPMADVLAIHAFLQRAVNALHQGLSGAAEP